MAEPILTKFERHNQNYKPELLATSQITFFEIQDGGQAPLLISEKGIYSTVAEPILTKVDTHKQKYNP